MTEDLIARLTAFVRDLGPASVTECLRCYPHAHPQHRTEALAYDLRALLSAISTEKAKRIAAEAERDEARLSEAELEQAAKDLDLKIEAAETDLTALQDDWDWLAAHKSLELSWSGEPEADPEWQVHEVCGGVNDREWTLVGSGETPLLAVQAARSALTKLETDRLGVALLG